MNNLGKARLYCSDRQELSFSNKYLEYWDYSAKKDNLSNASTKMEETGKQSTIPHFDLAHLPRAKGSFQSLPEDQTGLEPRVSSSKSLPPQSDISFKPKLCPSKVVLVSNINGTFDSVQDIYNFFSCYGDICKMIFLKNLQKAMIQFTQFEYSVFCVNNINN